MSACQLKSQRGQRLQLADGPEILRQPMTDEDATEVHH